jgi:hypothetical protein
MSNPTLILSQSTATTSSTTYAAQLAGSRKRRREFNISPIQLKTVRARQLSTSNDSLNSNSSTAGGSSTHSSDDEQTQDGQATTSHWGSEPKHSTGGKESTRISPVFDPAELECLHSGSTVRVVKSGLFFNNQILLRLAIECGVIENLIRWNTHRQRHLRAGRRRPRVQSREPKVRNDLPLFDHEAS